ncbi:MAG TPA: hypothetical protein DCZ95_08030 [Verrucomicrobia bacterium]|nr:hypothetical protein [Verrucomicrobiota bacterium]
MLNKNSCSCRSECLSRLSIQSRQRFVSS